jgi:hypothetical protein
VCRIFYINLLEGGHIVHVSTHTHTQGNNKNNEGKQHRRNGNEWKRAECDHVKKGQKRAARQNPSSK